MSATVRHVLEDRDTESDDDGSRLVRSPLFTTFTDEDESEERFNTAMYHAPSTDKTEITEVLLIGDSLTDRGEWVDDRLFGCIPGTLVTGLQGRSPQGSFTNGFAWSDFVATWLANRCIIEPSRELSGLDDIAIAEALITRDKRAGIAERVLEDFNLDNAAMVSLKPKSAKKHVHSTDAADAILTHDKRAPQYIKERGLSVSLFSKPRSTQKAPQIILRSYAQGGLTASDWTRDLTFSISRGASRHILPTLADTRRQIEADDNRRHLSRAQKAKILVTEWSGVNDQITVNAVPSEYEVRRAVAARVENVRQLLALGYRQFVWLNQPDLSLLPRFQARDEAAQETARNCSLSFNVLLEEERQKLCEDYPYVNVQIFDVASIFSEVYHNPKKYGFDPLKLRTPYVTSHDFDKPDDGVSEAKSYFFWDDVHPTADVHALIGLFYVDFMMQHFKYMDVVRPSSEGDKIVTETELMDAFRIRYQETLAIDARRWTYFAHKSKIDYLNASLEDVVHHAFIERAARTRGVLEALGWVDNNGSVLLNAPTLVKILRQMQPPAPLAMGCHLQ
ncbi:SGNH/GDSL hydrolase family protein [Legionella geestiana]|uniref:SGNH/GDSL hydrolase family protein n=1 Tax=Legionella geestiana TaxID=45065 RepID=UPI001091AA74|nr:SGNH/GDSL hydrolase family protein [Legionella geestiana]QDQ40931.1 SGNH/GDSL hydrolase family protein [Legionella geestiana]